MVDLREAGSGLRVADHQVGYCFARFRQLIQLNIDFMFAKFTDAFRSDFRLVPLCILFFYRLRRPFWSESEHTQKFGKHGCVSFLS